MTITLRADKGSALTHDELDANFTTIDDIKASVADGRFTGSITLPHTSGKGIQLNPETPVWGWRDITAEIDPRSAAGATVPTFAQYTGTNFYLHKFSATVMQEVFCVFHIPHDYVPGTDIYLHTHWSNAAAAPNTGNVVWGFEYSFAKGHQQAAFPTSSTVTVTQACNATRYWHHIAETAAVTISGLEVDGILMVRVYRDATNVSDTCTDAVFLHTADVHYQSTNVATKNKAPSFYA